MGAKYVAQVKTLRLRWRALSCVDTASEHSNRNVKHESHVDCDWKDPAYLEAMSKAVTIRDGMVDRIV